MHPGELMQENALEVVPKLGGAQARPCAND